MVVLDSCSRVLGRLRCLRDCAEAVVTGQQFPECMCYVPEYIEFKPRKSFALSIYAHPDKTSQKTELLCTSKHRVLVSATSNDQIKGGRWLKIKRILDAGILVKLEPTFQWIIFSDIDLVKAKVSDEVADSWEHAVDYTYLLSPVEKKGICCFQKDEAAVEQLRKIPAGWSLNHDQALVDLFIKENCEWTARDFVESIECSEDNNEVERLLNGVHGYSWYVYSSPIHLILTMKKETVVNMVQIRFVDEGSRTTLPTAVSLFGGEKGSEVLLKGFEISGYSDLVNGTYAMVLGESQYFPSIKLEFKGTGFCIAGIHLEGMICGQNKHDFIFSKRLTPKTVESEPLIASFDLDFLHSRFELLQRTADLHDSVMTYIVPLWEHSPGSFDCIKVLRTLMPISKKRKNLIQTLLQKSSLSSDADTPFLHIKRNFMNSIKSAKDTVFCQIYDGLMRDEANKGQGISYRAANSLSQWWKCAFIGEGIIDQGGGFRDTVSDISEELCPSEADSQIVLPFFIPCANQQSGDASNFRDAYVPNPSCSEFQKYEWIGKLMGACIRSNERLSVTLSPFFWKKLAGNETTWLDYASVDEAQVKTLNEMEKMDEATYAAFFGELRTWNVVLSDGTSVPLKPNGDQLVVSYSERLEYVRLVKEARMNESNQQVAAIQRGFFQVVPKVVLWLLTPGELELKVCSSHEILFEDLKKHVIISDADLKTSETLKYFWKVLEDFSSTDRSQFIRFATGRRRLPTDVYISRTAETDVLPSSSTCGHHFYLPNYTSVKKAEELIRMAIYSCKLIDTDTAVLE